MGSSLTIVNDTQDTWHCHLGPSWNYFPSDRINVRKLLKGVNRVDSSEVANHLIIQLHADGFDTILAGGQQRYDKLTLSLARQGSCAKVIVKNDKIVVHKMYMNAIYSGPTDKSNRDHSIQWWLDNYRDDRQFQRLEEVPMNKP